MICRAVASLGMLLLMLSVAIANPQDATNGASEIEAKIAAAKECNTYVHFRKGEDAHCLFDPVVKNAILTAFHNSKTGVVRLGETNLIDGDIKELNFGGSAFCVIYKKQRLVFVNIDTGQTGVVPLRVRKVQRTEH